MANHNPETVLKLLKSWQAKLNKQTEALSHGNIPKMELLFQDTLEIQHRLSHMLSESKHLVKDKNIARIIKELYDEQEELIQSLITESGELAREIGILEKNQASLKGYKKSSQTPPRFMNERT